MKLNKLFILSLVVASLFFANCSVSDNDANDVDNISGQFTFGQSVSRSFTGQVVDKNNNPISSATVTIEGQSLVTNSDGRFTLNNVTVKQNFAYFRVQKAGYLDGSRVAITHEGNNHVVIMMLEKELTATIQTGVVSNVTLPNSSNITFDGAFMYENGTAYNGEVNVYVQHLDAADPNVFVKMPGNLLGERTDGSISGMETYGMVNVELYGANNEKLQIAQGHKAVVTLPIAPNQLDTAPNQIPLWYFNDATGLWVEEGFSVRSGNKYVGEVAHFTWWNNDYAYVVATLNVHVKNFDNTNVQGVRITITRQAGSTGDVLMDLGFTGANGRLSAGVPRNEELIFRAYNVDGVLIDERVLPASSLLVRDVEVIIPIQNRVANTTTKG